MRSLHFLMIFVFVVLNSTTSYAGSAPSVSEKKDNLVIKFPKKTFEYPRVARTAEAPIFKAGTFYEKQNLYLVEEVPYEFGPYYRLINEKNEISISAKPQFNPSGDTFVIVQNKEAGDGTYGIDVWRKDSNDKWTLKEKFKHPGGSPYLEFVQWAGNESIQVKANHFEKGNSGPYTLPLKEVPNALKFLKLNK